MFHMPLYRPGAATHHPWVALRLPCGAFALSRRFAFLPCLLCACCGRVAAGVTFVRCIASHILPLHSRWLLHSWSFPSLVRGATWQFTHFAFWVLCARITAYDMAIIGLRA